MIEGMGYVLFGLLVHSFFCGGVMVFALVIRRPLYLIGFLISLVMLVVNTGKTYDLLARQFIGG